MTCTDTACSPSALSPPVPSWTTHFLPDLQCPLAQGLGLLVFATLTVQHRQVVEGGGHLWGMRSMEPGPEKNRVGDLSSGLSLTAGWSLPRVFSRMARASLSRWAASLYLFWSLGGGREWR